MKRKIIGLVFVFLYVIFMGVFPVITDGVIPMLIINGYVLVCAMFVYMAFALVKLVFSKRSGGI